MADTMVTSSFCQDCEKRRCHYCLKEGEFVIKVILLGDRGVGKYNLSGRFCNGVFEPYRYRHRYPIDPVFIPAHRTIGIDGKTVKFYVHEVDGHDIFRRGNVPLPFAYFRDIAGALLVYDVTKRSTFEHIEYLLKQVRERATYHSDVPILLVGNKCDLINEREVTKEEARVYAGKNAMSFIETSARLNYNVATAFKTIFKEIHCSKDADDSSFFATSTEIVNIAKEDRPSTMCCGII